MTRKHLLRSKPVAAFLLLAWIFVFCAVPAIDARADSLAQATFYVH